MDTGRSNQKYPGYTLKQLKAFIASGQGNDVMEQEVYDRENGFSVAFKVPQIGGGKPVVKIGRM